MSIKIYPYKQGSRSARALADAVGGRVLKLQGSRYRPRQRDLIINWGSSSCPFENRLNNPSAVAQASDKLSSFDAMKDAGVSIPDFWTNGNEIPDDAFPIVCRTILRGHSGAGIHIAETREELVNAPLYVRYKKKQDEFRVHVFQGRIIAVQQKRRRHDCENPDWRVRNHSNGFVFARMDVRIPEGVESSAIAAVAALGLDFGGVDVIYNNRNNNAYVLEVNTACGLEGQTVVNYAEAILELLGR